MAPTYIMGFVPPDKFARSLLIISSFVLLLLAICINLARALHRHPFVLERAVVGFSSCNVGFVSFRGHCEPCVPACFFVQCTCYTRVRHTFQTQLVVQ